METIFHRFDPAKSDANKVKFKDLLRYRLTVKCLDAMPKEPK